MNKLKAIVGRLIPPKDHSTRDPYTVVIRLTAERAQYGVAALCLMVVFVLIVSIPPVASFLAARELLGVLCGVLGGLFGLFAGFWMVGTLFRECLDSIAYDRPPASMNSK